MSKPSERFLVLLIGAVFLAFAPTVGCDSGASFSANLLPYSEQTRLADDAIRDAIAAFNKGDQAKGDGYLHRAVILLTGPPTDEFNDEGFIEVARRITALGRPHDAIRLLEPLTQDKRVSGDPRLWAALADAAKKAASTARAGEAEERARQEADAIFAGFGTTTIPGSKQAAKMAALATYAGQYFSEFEPKDYPKATAAYREAVRLMPRDPVMNNNLGYLLADHGVGPEDFEEAVKLTRSVVEKVPNHPFFLDSFGWALHKRDNPEERDREGARRRLREAVDLAPDMPESRYHLAAAYERLDRLSDALREAERAVLLKPDFPEAVALVERLKPLIAALPSPTPDASPSPTPDASPTSPASAGSAVPSGK